MNDFSAYEVFLMKERRSSSTIRAHLSVVRRFAAYQESQERVPDIDSASTLDITRFVEDLSAQGESVKGLLWSLHNYYRFSKNKSLHDHALALRVAAMKPDKKRRAAPKLSTLVASSEEAISALEARGIRTTKQLLPQVGTPAQRRGLAEECDVPQEAIDDLAYFSDLCRITDIKGKRGRFLLAADIRTVGDLRTWDPEQLLEHLTKLAKTADVGNRPPTLAETRYWVRQASELPDVLELT
jgi:hypothetical protein